jgi:hypothetical protein
VESPGLQKHRSQVELPSHVEGTFDVFVNGVPQARGIDYEQRGRKLLFESELSSEGKLGFWRWISLFFGVAGTYRKNDIVDIVFTRNGQRTVESLQAVPIQEASPTSSE